MKKTLFIFALIMLSVSCGNNKKENTDNLQSDTKEISDEEIPVLLGKQDINTIKEPPYSKWFMDNYRYNPTQSVLGPLKKAMEGVHITIFMGTWCEDSQLQVPALLNVLVSINYNQKNITLITVSEDKDTPEGLEDGFNIRYVPTIILYKNGDELGRIVEYPIENIETDLLAIATGKDYKHAYADEDENQDDKDPE